jgi:hypothetical protein
MRYLRRFIWSALILGASSAPAFAQGGGMSGGGGGGGGGGGMSGGGGSSGGVGGGSSLTGTSLSTLAQPSQIQAPTAAGGNQGNSVSTSNFLSEYYANPYYQGILNNATSGNNSPGGFGAQLFGSSGSSSPGGQIGFAGASSGGATGGRTGGGARGTSSSSTNQSGVVVAAPYQISYPTRANFTVPLDFAKIQKDIAGDIARSKFISNPAGIQVSVDANGVVTLRGSVKNQEEAANIVRMVNLSPGQRGVISELK